MMIFENENYRELLVKIIIESFFKEKLFDTIPTNLNKEIQDFLDLNLKFKTNVLFSENKNQHIIGGVSFENETGNITKLDFKIANSLVNN